MTALLGSSRSIKVILRCSLGELTVDEFDHGQQVGVQHKDQRVRAPLLQLLHEDDLRGPLLHCIVWRWAKEEEKDGGRSQRKVR